MTPAKPKEEFSAKEPVFEDEDAVEEEVDEGPVDPGPPSTAEGASGPVTDMTTGIVTVPNAHLEEAAPKDK